MLLFSTNEESNLRAFRARLRQSLDKLSKVLYVHLFEIFCFISCCQAVYIRYKSFFQLKWRKRVFIVGFSFPSSPYIYRAPFHDVRFKS